MTLDSVRPLIVPSEYFSLGEFPAPHVPLVAADLALTCVSLTEGQTMVYVQPQEVQNWQRSGVDWTAAAVAAMRRADEGLVWTHELRDPAGKLLWIAFMNADGLGSSRLLLWEDLERLFPQGYSVALPDRSCGMAISKGIDREGLEELRHRVTAMHQRATVPMCADIREPHELRRRAA